MKAIVLKAFGGIENFELQEIAKPGVSPGNILVRIKASAFNPIDYQMRKGSTESKLLKSPVLGREFSGIVEEVGEGVQNFKSGDEVAAYSGSLGSNGAYAEYIGVPAVLAAHKPKSISFAEAAAIPMAGMTALQIFNRLSAKISDSFFISGGAGGVGSVVIKLLMINGYKNIITTAGNEESVRQLTVIGVDAASVLDYKSPDLVTQVLALNNAPIDFCIDLVGGRMSEICSEIIKVHGTYVDVTHLGTSKANETLFDKATTVINVTNYAYTLTGSTYDLIYYGKSLTKLFDLILHNKITAPEVMVAGNFSAETVGKAHMLLENNLSKGKKIIMLH